MDGTFQKCLTLFLFLAVNIVAGVLSMTVPSEEEQHTKAANMTIHPEFDPTFGSDDLCMIKVQSIPIVETKFLLCAANLHNKISGML